MQSRPMRAEMHWLVRLTSTVASLFPTALTEAELTTLVKGLEVSGKTAITDDNVTYFQRCARFVTKV